MTIESVTGGTVVGPAGLERADVLIGDDGRVAAVVPPGGPAAGDHVVDASGCYVLPGGVDPHCHAMSAVADAARARRRRGTTTVLSFTNPDQGENALSCLQRTCRGHRGGPRPAVDIGPSCHGRRSRATFEGRHRRPSPRKGPRLIKVFLAYRELGIMCRRSASTS